MVFSDTTNKNGAVQFIESLCKLGDGGITNDTTLYKQITSYFNQSCKKVATALLRVDKNWKWDDFNYTDFPIATIDLVNGQRDYTLPASTSGGNASTLWRVNRVRIMGTDGLYYQIPMSSPLDNETQSGSAYYGTPTSYKMIGNSIRLSPIPSTSTVTLTAGLEVQFQRSGDDFTTADTTQQPGFPDAYHDLPCYDTASAYLMPLNTQLAINYSTIFNQRLELLSEDWSNRNDDNKNQIRTVYRRPR
ncbi:hypothetical protein M0R04_14145 [Candidatus Dojkabacteria bacterium]|jgi:hypothetical protein|nr:hypothetical protein [Candidatus Dojkabacteria bacterium]